MAHHDRSTPGQLDTNPPIPGGQPKLPCDSHGLGLRRPSCKSDLTQWQADLSDLALERRGRSRYEARARTVAVAP